MDADLLAAAEHAVTRGDAPTISAWINDAIRLKLDHDRRLEALAEFIAEFEAEHGPLTERDRENTLREAKRRAISVRGGLRAGEPRKRYGK